MSESTDVSLQKPNVASRIDEVIKGIYPQHSTLPVFLTLALFAVIFIPIGAVVILASDKVVKVEVRYDDVNNYTYRIGVPDLYPTNFTFNNTKFSTGAHARRSFHLSKSLTAPVYLRYRLVGFHQNYREYTASRDLGQLLGGDNDPVTECKPFRYPGELQGQSVAGIYSPCGSIAWSLFNDSISLFQSPQSGVVENSTEVPPGAVPICEGGAFDAAGNPLTSGNLCKKKGIALLSDVELFRSPATSSDHGPVWMAGGDPNADNPFQKDGFYFEEPGHRIPTVQDEDFIVWSSVSFLADFTKNYRIITTDLAAGDYFVDINENFDVHSFSGKKYVVLTTPTWIGGKNYVLGILLLVMGCLSFVFAVGVVSVHYGRKRIGEQC